TTQIEAFYRFQLTDNISITPGIIHILEPGNTPDSDSVTIGILRSTFTF
ncbi:MAG: carbohydrate porin, partial [Nostoc sp.]